MPANAIYAEMLPYAKNPQNIFEGSDTVMGTLLRKIRSAQGARGR